MRKVNPLLKRGLKIVEDDFLLKVLQSEIRHEISHPRFQESIEEADTSFPRGALAKLCIKKPGLSSIMQFDCRVSETGSRISDFDIDRAYFIRSARSSTYGEELFWTLDPKLQDALKQYLISKGISEDLTNFLLCHLNKKEQDQYVNWLRKLESTMSHSLKP